MEIVAERQSGRNVSRGDVLSHDCRNTLAISGGRLVACTGVSDIVVVETPDAILVSHKDRTQDVKYIEEQLKAAGRRASAPNGTYLSASR